ncbi:MAG: autotransporter assembly complex protein TamA [Gammaproteobacteria bacterium]
MSFIKPISPIVWITLLTYPITVPADISVSGLDEEAKANVKLTLSLAAETCDTPEWKIRHLFAEADKEIDQALRAVGYYNSHSQNQLRFDDNCWHAEFKVDAGPPVIVQDIDITIDGEGKVDPEFQKLTRSLKEDTGSVLNHGRYEAMKSKLESLALERGYFKARLSEKKLLVDKENNQADIELAYDTGPRLYFGNIVIDQDILDPKFVDKFISIKAGDNYDADILAKTHNDLSKSGYFKSVDIHPELERSENNIVPVRLTLSPQKTHHYSIGLGFDTDKGPLLGISYKNRRLNREGHLLDFNLDLSPVLATADAEYEVPLDKPLTDFFTFGGGLKREHTDTYRSLSAKVSARLKHTLDNGWKQTLFLDEIYESFKTDGNTRNAFLLLPGASWLHSVTDNPLHPTQGYRFEFNVSATYKNPLSDISMAQGSASAVWIEPAPWDSRFVIRAQQGATVVDQFDKLPTTYRFFAGGMNSIRGYSYKELGPKDAAGDVIGGRFLSVLSLEYEKTIFDNWGVATFVDSGNAYNLNNISIKTGVGLGARWYSPIGLIRVDFAMPLNDADSSFQIHFAAGTRL